MIDVCPVCGGTVFSSGHVICENLARDWELSPEEVAYIDLQQSYTCEKCHNNLRTMALAQTIMNTFHFTGLFEKFVSKWRYRRLKVLEINSAGALHEQLKCLPNLVFAEYPEYDMNTLIQFPDESFDLVLHSDTLEHILTPVKALNSCRRVLKNGGYCIFTIPMVVNRLSRSRAGMSKSYHGTYSEQREDFIVHTEFGADAWQYVVRAGFHDVTISTLDYPAATVMKAQK